MSKLKSFPRSPRQAAEGEAVTPDELAYLQSMGEQERTTMAALQATRASYNNHLAQKYQLVQGDSITTAGQIVRAKKAEQAG